jgi:hypothetical protein
MESGELVVLVIGLCIVGCVCVAFVFAPRGLGGPIGMGGPIGPGGPIGSDQSDRGPLLASS